MGLESVSASEDVIGDLVVDVNGAGETGVK